MTGLPRMLRAVSDVIGFNITMAFDRPAPWRMRFGAHHRDWRGFSRFMIATLNRP